MEYIRKFIQKLNKMSPAAKASFWFVVANVGLKGISFITTPIFTRLLNVADYGTTSVFVAWESVISIFATLSLAGGVYNVAMTKYEDDIDAYTSSMLGLTALSTSLVYALCIGINWLYPRLFQLDTAYLLYMWIQTFTNAVMSFWMMRKRFVYDYKSVISFTFANALGSPVAAILAVWLFPGNKAYAKVIGAGILSIVIGIIVCLKSFRKGRTVYHKAYWNYALKFNIPLIPHYLASVILNSADKLMLNNFVGAAEAGLYSIAHSITGLISLITQAINYSLIPYTLQSIKKGQLRNLYKVVLGCSVLVSAVCLGVILFAKEGVIIFATPDYIAAVWFVAPLSFSVLLSFVSGLIGNVIFYYEKTKYMSGTTMICGIANLVLNYFGIKYFGYLAVGYTTLMCSFIRMILYYICARNFEKNLNQIVNLKYLFIIYAGFAVCTIVAMCFYEFIWLRLLLIGMILITIFAFKTKIIGLFSNMKSRGEDAE